MSEQSKPKVKKTTKIECPNSRSDPESYCQGPAVQIVYTDGTIEVKCPYCGYKKKM